MRFALPLFSLLLAAGPGGAADFETHEFTSRDKAKMPYRLLKPEGQEKDKKYPIVLILHGWGERGTDNNSQLKQFGPAFLKPAVREKFPSFVLVPQANGSWVEHPEFEKAIAATAKPTTYLRLAVEILDAVTKKEAVDTDRIYVMGYSNGACGVWELLERYPQRWAAAAPMAGAGDPAHVKAAKQVPIWAFHGNKDTTIPWQRMTEMMDSLRTVHGSAMYTVIPNRRHYDAKGKGLAEPNLIPWMFAQRRGQAMAPFAKVAGSSAKAPQTLD